MGIWQLYWMTRFDSICKFSAFMAFAFGIALAVAIIFWVNVQIDEDNKSYEPLAGKLLSRSLIAFFFFSAGCIFTPDNEDLAIMIGGYWVTNTEEVKKLPVNVVKTMNDFLEKYQKEEKEKGK